MELIRELIETIKNIRIIIFQIPDVQAPDASLVATWASVIVAILALIFSILVPYQIARKQNKIALFDKRIEAYLELEKCFKNRNLYSVAITNHIFPERKPRTSLNPFEGNNRTLLFTVGMLFPSVKKSLEKLESLYKEIIEYDCKISDGIDYLLLANESKLRRIIGLFEDEILYEPNEHTKKELREISESYYRVPKDEFDYDNIPCNLYVLFCEQNALINKACEVEKNILAFLAEEALVK